MRRVYLCSTEKGKSPISVLISLLTKCILTHQAVSLYVKKESIQSIDLALWETSAFLPHKIYEHEHEKDDTIPITLVPLNQLEDHSITISNQYLNIFFEIYTEHEHESNHDKNRIIYIGEITPHFPKPYDLYTYTKEHKWDHKKSE